MILIGHGVARSNLVSVQTGWDLGQFNRTGSSAAVRGQIDVLKILE